jgi:hypothetical protein
MGVIDPWVSLIQNTFDVLGTYVVIGLDLLSTDAGNAVRKVSSVVMGIFDELANGVMATFDMMVGEIQKAWIRITGYLQGATDTQSKLDAIDKENQSRADQRGKDRPGLAARMNEAISTNATESQAARDRQSAAMSDLDRRMMGREDANRRRAADRMAAVEAAKTALDQKVASTSAPASVSRPQEVAKSTTSIAGTFSAFGVGQMAGGDVQKLQLDESIKQTKLLGDRHWREGLRSFGSRRWRVHEGCNQRRRQRGERRRYRRASVPVSRVVRRAAVSPHRRLHPEAR